MNNGTFFNQTCFTVNTHGEEEYKHVVHLINITGSQDITSASDEYFKYVYYVIVYDNVQVFIQTF